MQLTLSGTQALPTQTLSFTRICVEEEENETFNVDVLQKLAKVSAVADICELPGAVLARTTSGQVFEFDCTSKSCTHHLKSSTLC